MSSSTENPIPPNETLHPVQPDNLNIPPNADKTKESSKDALPQKIAELVDAFPKEQRAEIISNLLEKLEVNDEKGYMSMARMTHFSGPFPHPDILKGMNDVVPGAAER